MRYLGLIVLLIFLFSSCKKEKQDELNKFKFQYVFVNKGDSKASRMTLYASTSFPFERETFVLSTGKNIFAVGTQDYLKSYDSIVYTPELDLYKGCIIYLNARIGRLDSSKGTEDIEKYTIMDTIKFDYQTKLRIVWPNDSNKFYRE